MGCALQGGSERKHLRLQFGQFEADLQSQQLYKRGLPVRLEKLPFLVLTALLERPGSAVSREELRARLWPNGTHVDFDEGLNTAVRKLRHALGDSADTPLFIETVPRKGYILIAPVAEASALPYIENDQHLLPGNNSGNGVAVDVRATPISPKPTRNLFYVLAVGLVILAFSLWQVLRHHAPSQPDFARLSFRRGTIVSARLSPDGQQVVFGAAWDGKPFRLFLVRGGSPDIRDLGIEADILAISRSGQMAVMLHRHFGFGTVWSRGTLATVSLTGTVPKETLDDVSSADWSPDGSQLAVVHYSGGSCRLEFPVGHVVYEATGGAWISHARISPVGDRIAFLEHPLANDDAGHAVILQLGNGQKTLSKDFSAIVGLAWEGAGLLFTASEAGVGGGRAIFRFAINGSQSLVRRESVSLTIHDVTPDGGLLLTRDIQGDEVFGHFQDDNPDRIVSCLNVCVPADLSADGSQLLVSGQGEGLSPGYRAYVLPTAAGAAPKLLGNGQPTGFAPDMQSVIVLFPWGIDPAQITQLRSLPVGPGEPKALTHDSLSHIWATWFPDGKRFLFLGAEPHHGARSWTQEVDAPNATPLTPEGVVGLKISPDGKTVAAIGADKKLWLYPALGGTPKLLGNVNADEEVDRWSADGKYLFLTAYGLPAEVDRIDVRTGARSLVHRVSPPDPAGVLAVGPVLVSADSRTYVYAYPRYLSTLYIVHGL